MRGPAKRASPVLTLQSPGQPIQAMSIIIIIVIIIIISNNNNN